MNLDRCHLSADRSALGWKYVTSTNASVFEPAREFLSNVIQPAGYIYKDVVQPFVVCDWLRHRPDIRVLKIRPDVVHAAFAMIRRNWLYPATAAMDLPGGILEHMVEGLRRAAQAIENVAGETVEFEDLLGGTAPLRHALRRLYPGRDLDAMSFGPGFEADRDAMLTRRSLPEYQTLAALAQNALARA